MFGHRNRTESGAIVVDGIMVAYTSQCVHCGSHEEIKRGSGKKRGTCKFCNGFLCGRVPCMAVCIPYEEKLNYAEAINSNNLKAIGKLLARYPLIDKIQL